MCKCFWHQLSIVSNEAGLALFCLLRVPPSVTLADNCGLRLFTGTTKLDKIFSQIIDGAVTLLMKHCFRGWYFKGENTTLISAISIITRFGSEQLLNFSSNLSLQHTLILQLRLVEFIVVQKQCKSSAEVAQK